MQLLFLLLLLVAPYALLTLAGRRFGGLRFDAAARARVGLSLFFAFTALGHFVRTEEMAAMLPPPVPYRVELIYLTGVFELMGAAGVWVPRLRRLTGICLILMLVAVLPSNVYAAFSRVDFGGHGAGPAYLLVRVPFQLFVIWWAYNATGQRWFIDREPTAAALGGCFALAGNWRGLIFAAVGALFAAVGCVLVYVFASGRGGGLAALVATRGRESR